MTAMIVIGLLFALLSNHGILYLIATLFASLTPLAWELAYAQSVKYAHSTASYPSSIFIVFLVLTALFLHYPNIQKLWLNLASAIVFIITIAFQCAAVIQQASFDLFGAFHYDNSLTYVLYLCLFLYIPAWLRSRAVFLPLALALSLSMIPSTR